VWSQRVGGPLDGSWTPCGLSVLLWVFLECFLECFLGSFGVFFFLVSLKCFCVHFVWREVLFPALLYGLETLSSFGSLEVFSWSLEGGSSLGLCGDFPWSLGVFTWSLGVFTWSVLHQC
jgi:hypothetical protein